MTRTPQPGDFGLSMGTGPAGWWINIGQAIIRDSSRYTHAFIVIDDKHVMEAKPSGAGIIPMSNYEGRAIFSHFDLTDAQRAAIVENALALKGTPYSFLDYLSLGAMHFGFKAKWLRKYVANSGHMICSQLVDYVYFKSGIHLFSDGREPQDVTPGDLLYTLLED